MIKASSSAVDLLIDFGCFPVNLEFFDIHTKQSDNLFCVVYEIFEHAPPDLDEINQKDLTFLRSMQLMN